LNSSTILISWWGENLMHIVARTFVLSLALLVALVVVVAQQRVEDSPPTLPGQMVDIGGYRLHLYCTGQGSPTVIFENGLGGIFADWALVQPGVAQFTRACSYDRAYEGYSDAGPIPITMHQQAFELHLLLQNAKLPPPYILVGHSYGGMLARLFAMTYPHDVAGLVLVDSLHEDTPMGSTMFRSRATGKPVPPPQTMQSSPPVPLTPDEQARFDSRKEQLEAEVAAPVSPPLDRLPPEALRLRAWAHAHPKWESGAKGLPEIWLPEELQQIHDARVGKVHPFGNLPVVVIGTTRDNPTSLEERRRQLDDMASLSSNSKVVIDSNSGHHVQWDDPTFVVESVRQDYEAAKHNSKLAR
jgi:pimeloyl-ACP methyl ester carboxylesterase